MATNIAILKREFELDLLPELPPVVRSADMLEEKLCRSKGKEMVFLLSLYDPVLIVPGRTGIVYRCQVGGYGCLPKWMEGFLIPLLPRERDAATFHKLNMWEWDERNPRFVAEVRRQMNGGESENVTNFEVLEHEDNTEAWVWSRFVLNGQERYGVITWQNSD